MRKEKKEIGSDHRIRIRDLFGRIKYDLDNDNTIFLSTGRDCLEYIIRGLGLGAGDKVLLPNFLCPEIIKTFKKHNLKTLFYDIRQDLSIDPLSFTEEIEKRDVKMALIIHYFGWPQKDKEAISKFCHKRGVVLVEDCVQSFFSETEDSGDITFNSYRKSLPVPDGTALKGILPHNVKIHKSPVFAKKRFLAGLLKNFSGLKRYWRPMFVEAEKLLVDAYERPAGMSWMAKMIIRRVDFEEVIWQRRENYKNLLEGLRNVSGVTSLYQSLPSDVVPFCMPVICEDRDVVRDVLTKKGIYCPIHWDCGHSLSKKILSIPVDQRYNEEDMKRIISVIKKWF